MGDLEAKSRAMRGKGSDQPLGARAREVRRDKEDNGQRRGGEW
jgi:hypothetical protein